VWFTEWLLFIWYFQMVRQLLGGILVSLLGLAIGLLGVEATVRFLESKGSTTKQWSDRPPFYFQHENSPTLKDYPYPQEKAPGTFRIAVVGDSYSFAPYMQFTDAFPKVLERMLNLNATSRKGEVVNFGVPGYSTSHEIEEVDHALKMGADAIILQITLNDPELKPYRPTGIRDFNRFGALQMTERQKWLFHYWHTLKFVVERLHNNKTRDEYTKYFLDLFENPKSRASFESSVEEIANKAKAANVPLLAVVFPLFGLPLDSEYPFTPIHQQVGEFLQGKGIPNLDLYSLYEGIPLERLQVIPGGDRHPNEIAHRMAGERIYQWLAQNSWIPDELKIRKRFEGRTQIIKEKPYADKE
jgi:hypothetical protein